MRHSEALNYFCLKAMALNWSRPFIHEQLHMKQSIFVGAKCHPRGVMSKNPFMMLLVVTIANVSFVHSEKKFALQRKSCDPIRISIGLEMPNGVDLSL